MQLCRSQAAAYLEKHVEALAILCQVSKRLLLGQALIQDAAEAVDISGLIHTAENTRTSRTRPTGQGSLLRQSTAGLAESEINARTIQGGP